MNVASVSAVPTVTCAVIVDVSVPVPLYLTWKVVELSDAGPVIVTGELVTTKFALLLDMEIVQLTPLAGVAALPKVSRTLTWPSRKPLLPTAPFAQAGLLLLPPLVVQLVKANLLAAAGEMDSVCVPLFAMPLLMAVISGVPATVSP